MTEVKILIEGYAKKTKDGWIASPSTVLIRDSGLNILADPGSNKKLLLKKLAEEKMKPEDIDIIFLTHYHLDHTLNIRLFPDCDILDGNEINKDDKILNYSGKIPNTNVKVIETPGHSVEHASLLVETAMGKIVVAGDVFWWTDDEKQEVDINRPDQAHSCDMKQLIKSRKKVLELADWVIPGHGKMFKVKK
jgi:glyoxylase-like metal-dependent hydrolase (beta-lactamase superfamily II)